MVLTSPVSYMKDGGWFSVYTKPLWGKNYKNSKTYNYMDFDEILPFTIPGIGLVVLVLALILVGMFAAGFLGKFFLRVQRMHLCCWGILRPMKTKNLILSFRME